MPVTLAKIASNTASVTIRVGDDTVTIVYYPSRVTEKIFTQLQAFSSMDESNVTASFETLNEILAGKVQKDDEGKITIGQGLIKSWDVFEDERQRHMFPIDPRRFPDLPLPFRLQVLKAILGDIRPETIAP